MSLAKGPAAQQGADTFDTSTRWRSRIVDHGEAVPEQLLANPRNWRLHPKGQQDALESVLDRVGWVQDVIVNQRTGHVVDGHLRVSLAISRQEPSIPVVYVDLDPDEEALILATIDPLAAMAGTDNDLLAGLLEDVSADGALGDMLAEMASQREPKVGLTDPDDVPEESADPYVQRGEVYRLGAHRVMCGDSTNAEDVAHLLEGEKPALMVTDPPYGVEYRPEWRAEAGVNRNRGKLGAVENDDRADWSDAWALAPADVAYVWHAGVHAGEVQRGLIANRFELRAQVIWVKERFALSRGHYHWRHEPCWYSVRKGARSHWIGGRKQQTVWRDSSPPDYDFLLSMYEALTADATTVWEISAREDSGHGHGTQKPVECMERPLRNHVGDVYEPFLGSGSTLIAAERQSRRCFGMELEPRYVQVAIERWENYTGGKADLA